jgi:hypothetical protein
MSSATYRLFLFYPDGRIRFWLGLSYGNAEAAKQIAVTHGEAVLVGRVGDRSFVVR